MEVNTLPYSTFQNMSVSKTIVNHNRAIRLIYLNISDILAELLRKTGLHGVIQFVSLWLLFLVFN